MSFLNTIKNLDAYPKTLEDFRVRTVSGALISVISGFIIISLVISELNLYLTTDVQPELFVDTTRGERLLINFDVVFPHFPCSYLSVDAMDISGETQLDVEHRIHKKRLDQNGREIAVERHDLRAGSLIVTQNKEACGSCYGAELQEGQCCNSCEEVREAYRRRGWSFRNPEGIAQCQAENWSQKMAEQQNEGCQVYGSLSVNKVAGNFHFAPGKSFQSQNMHVHDIHPLGKHDYNMSHTIVRLSFGEDFPGIINPLDGVTKTSKHGSEMYKYFVKIVPTIYEASNSQVIKTNQFAVTEHVGSSSGGESHSGLPGVFILYDLSPIMVKFTEKHRSFAHFLTGLCAIVGGVFTVAGLIDSFVHNSIHSLSNKIKMGKDR